MMSETISSLPILQPLAVPENPTPFGPAQGKSFNGKKPTYSYNPDVNFQQGENTEPLDSRLDQMGRLDWGGLIFPNRHMAYTVPPA